MQPRDHQTRTPSRFVPFISLPRIVKLITLHQYKEGELEVRAWPSPISKNNLKSSTPFLPELLWNFSKSMAPSLSWPSSPKITPLHLGNLVSQEQSALASLFGSVASYSNDSKLPHPRKNNQRTTCPPTRRTCKCPHSQRLTL